METPSKRRALVADDDEVIRYSLTLFLRSMGFEVDVASNYIGTKEFLDRNVYALIISDNGMPISFEPDPDPTCGLQLLAYAKDGGHNVATPFVLHTAGDSSTTKEQAQKFGGVYLQKGGESTIKELTELIETLLPR